MEDFIASLFVFFIVGVGFAIATLYAFVEIYRAKFISVYLRYPVLLLITSASVLIFCKTFIIAFDLEAVDIKDIHTIIFDKF